MIALCEVFDAYFEIKTGEWTEQACPDPDCFYCNSRPPTHMEDCPCVPKIQGLPVAS